MGSVARLSGPIHLGMDVAMDSNVVGILPWGRIARWWTGSSTTRCRCAAWWPGSGAGGRLRACLGRADRLWAGPTADLDGRVV